jgi:predicted glycogen debranching enzyme
LQEALLMNDVAQHVQHVQRRPWLAAEYNQTEPLLTREWLVTNGLGGYASGTVAGVATRRYHGLLVAALPAPLGRCVMLGQVHELVRVPSGQVFRFGGEERVGAQLDLYGADRITEFCLEAGLPVWRFEVEGSFFEKRLFLSFRQNTVHITYRLLSGPGPIRLKLRPSVHFRSHEDPVSRPLANGYCVTVINERNELSLPGSEFPPLRFRLFGRAGAFTIEGRKFPEVLYRIEESRGYESAGEQWAPGYFRVDLAADQPVTLLATTEPWEDALALPPAEAYAAELGRREKLLIAAPEPARMGMGAELVLAADQFLITPVGRAEDAMRARARGDEVRTVIAGYHWFTDWGRDTMISLDGLTLATGRHYEAGYILRTFAHYVRDGLIPNFFPDGKNEGLYHTADATLWFFHALDRYLQATDDRATLRHLLPILRDIVECHQRGTRFGIGVDHTDGLLRQGAEGYQLTWMDAKVNGWVVTPRRGKAVEINALWYNALRLLESWLRLETGAAETQPLAAAADQAQRSFNARFWYATGGHLYDVIDGEHGDDPACRPNQVLALSLRHPVLDPAKWRSVVRVVQEKLLTPVGLRSLAPGHPDYKPRYFGDLRSRDAAYHQGTVWGWLIGPFLDAFLRVYPEKRPEARELLVGFERHLSEAGLGTISEVFDAEAPFTPRGCIAQAWSVAEVLRCWVLTAP